MVKGGPEEMNPSYRRGKQKKKKDHTTLLPDLLFSEYIYISGATMVTAGIFSCNLNRPCINNFDQQIEKMNDSLCCTSTVFEFALQETQN
ncbi:hypothetical protein TNIN_328731 [Trichonephila inaurata madagascariensis]|uniref:Uncharacterized protein n=1 Tax=Trichonephila inaurata madagascariensis TaxID=2747483 RepID=A0A8X6WUZ9_9ARAC|nr:hypothetical protein TNIN_328731 [Trichonephila inaurata madagascariensis]